MTSFIIPTEFDETGMTQGQIDFKKALIASKELGLNFSYKAKLISKIVQLSKNKNGGTIRKVISVIEENKSRVQIKFTDTIIRGE